MTNARHTNLSAVLNLISRKELLVAGFSIPLVTAAIEISSAIVKLRITKGTNNYSKVNNG